MKYKVNSDVILTIDIEIIIWHIFTEWNGGTTIVSQMEDSGFHTKPIHVSMLGMGTSPGVKHTSASIGPKQLRYAYLELTNIQIDEIKFGRKHTFCLGQASRQ
jgi:hypothetical protein